MISVIIPVYNAGEKLYRMVQSIQNQTESDFEVLLIDDGSTDDSGKICDCISREDTRFKCIHQENQGVSAARNLGMAKASGEYITFLDADDWIESNYFEELLRGCQNAEVSVCDLVCESDSGIITKKFSCSERVMEASNALNYLLGRIQINSGPYAKMYKKGLLQGLSYPPLKTYEDIIFTMNAFNKGKTVSSTTHTAYHYVTNPAGAMNNYLKCPSEDIIVATKEILEFISEKKNLDEQCLYTTISHLMQYVIPQVDNRSLESRQFIAHTQNLFRKWMKDILACKAFPWKEKVYYLIFIWGFFWDGKRLRKL